MGRALLNRGLSLLDDVETARLDATPWDDAKRAALRAEWETGRGNRDLARRYGVGAVVENAIEIVGDHDWFRIQPRSRTSSSAATGAE